MSDPDINAQLAKLERLTTEAAAAAEEAGKPAAALVPAVDAGVPAVAMKTRLAGARADIVRRKQAIDALRRDLETTVRARMDAALATLGPLQEQVKQLEEGIWTVNLYLGRDEEIVSLATGAPAPADTPIVVRQLVLYMDQESLLDADRGGIDFRNIESFDQWITGDPARLQQVLPETRGVVAIKARRPGTREYGDPWTQDALDRLNNASYFLIRNGENLYRMITDFNVGARLVPARDEFTGLFTERRHDWDTGEYRTVPLEPGSHQWMKAEKAQGARERHYMRVALILQGLIDRTAVLHPLPAEGVSLLTSASYEAGHVVLLADDENTVGTGREPFYTWLRRLCRQARPGMRIVGDFGYNFKTGDDYDSRLHPRHASRPKNGVMHRIERAEKYRGDDTLTILYDRTDTLYSYDRGEYVPARRASCRLYPGHDRTWIPVDLADVETMNAYLHARTERHAYADMVPILQAAIAAKTAEAEAEAPFLELLAGAIVTAHDADPDDARAAVRDLADWWKLANKWHRPLVAGDDPDAERRAIGAIVAEYARRAGAERHADTDAAMLARFRAHDPAVVLVARKPSGEYVAYAPARTDLPDGIVAARLYVTSYLGRPNRDGLETREWVRPAAAIIARWRPVWAADEWNGWNTTAVAAEHITGPEVEAATASIRDWAAGLAGHPVPNEIRSTRPTGITYGAPWAITWRAAVTGERAAHVYLYVDGALDFHGYPEFQRLTITWRRTDGEIVLQRHGWPRTDTHRYASREAAWDTDRHVQVWSDPEVAGRLNAALATQRAAETLARRRATRARAIQASIHAARVERHEAALYARFLEDYLDADLWPDHRKTFKLDVEWAAGERDLATWLADRDESCDGMTVADAVALRLAEDGTPAPADLADLGDAYLTDPGIRRDAE